MGVASGCGEQKAGVTTQGRPWHIRTVRTCVPFCSVLLLGLGIG